MPAWSETQSPVASLNSANHDTLLACLHTCPNDIPELLFDCSKLCTLVHLLKLARSNYQNSHGRSQTDWGFGASDEFEVVCKSCTD